MSGVRLDLLILECCGELVKTIIEPRCGNVPIWDGAIREIAAAKLKELGVPSEPVTIVDACRRVGVLGPDPSVIVVNPKRKGRAACTD